MKKTRSKKSRDTVPLMRVWHKIFKFKLFYESVPPPLQPKFHLWILFRELRGLSPNFHIHVSVSSLYIPRIRPQISCSRIGRSTVGRYKSLTETWMWKLGLWPRNSFSGYPIRTVSNVCEKFAEINLLGVSFSPTIIVHWCQWHRQYIYRRYQWHRRWLKIRDN